MFADPLTARIAGFLESIGIPVSAATLDHPTFLPGVHISRGGLLADPARLTWPGDLLHEAGHLAVMEPARRAATEGSAGDNGGEEMAAIAWSYAAALAIPIEPELVFHSGGYQTGGSSLIENFRAGRTIGVPLLQWMGLTTSAAYPAMTRWLRE